VTIGLSSVLLNLCWFCAGYAAKCIWNHNPELEDTGENLFVGTGSLDLREALEKWFLEHLDYDFQNNSCDEDQMCGHYTQVRYKYIQNNTHFCVSGRVVNFSFLVCNYYPASVLLLLQLS
uniref:SCP domain-containing protein n=1 Tax=Cyclopterus lumpus TaxID=8103 RepID=A0A8C2YWG3_CYCLU